MSAIASGTETLLALEALNTYYGDSHILKDLSLEVRRGETVALLGRNGVGKTTTLKSIVGWVPARSGRVLFDNADITRADMMANARRGISLVPEERRIFTNLTVFENLKLAQVTARRPGWSLADVYARFPRLQERASNKGDEISGGEKQMLAIARALVQDTRLLLLDEPTEGLAPLIVREVEAIVREIKAQGMTILLVEQNFYSALSLADRCYVIDQGTIKFEGTPEDLRENTEVLGRYLHV
ncbi:MAG TPA: ABC transporter ATP-binding protein [Candidatus Baltobacteraceae bacterium]|nr:ABC transporter ATP-binding protein [Candidatus Baltobacteraceae bacterium]